MSNTATINESLGKILGNLHPLLMSVVSSLELANGSSAIITEIKNRKKAEEVGTAEALATAEKVAEKATKDAEELTEASVIGSALQSPGEVVKAENVVTAFELQQKAMPGEAEIPAISQEKIYIIAHRFAKTDPAITSNVETPRLAVHKAYANYVAQQVEPGVEFKAMVLNDKKLAAFIEKAESLPIKAEDLHNYKDVEALETALEPINPTKLTAPEAELELQ